MAQRLDEFEGFERREDFEAPDADYEQDELLMNEAEYEFINDEAPSVKGIREQAKHETSHNNSRKEEKMLGRKKRDEGYDESEVMEEMDEEMMEETEEVERKPVRKKEGKSGKPQGKKRKSGLKLMLLGLAVVLLLGVGYFAWEMLMVPEPIPQQTYRPPVKPRVHPQERTAKPVPVQGRQAGQAQRAGQPQSATELVMLEGNGKRGEAVAIVESSSAPVPAARQPANVNQIPAQKIPMNTGEMERNNGEIDKGLKEIKKQLDEISKTLEDLRGMAAAASVATKSQGAESSREALKGLTAEIQSLTAKNKSLSAEMDKAQKKITELRGIIAQNKGGKSVAASKKEEKKQEKRGEEKRSGGTNNWEILGFSGNRVVIADEKGTHSINVGQSYNGVKVISVDVESGAVKTSSGTLKYGQ